MAFRTTESHPIFQTALRTRRSLTLAIAGIFALATISRAADLIDLPYQSPSTGVDGELIIPDALPLFSERSSPSRLAYDATRGYLLAAARPFDNSENYNTYAYINGVWTFLDSDTKFSEPTFAFDAARGEVIRFGGYDDFRDLYEDVTRVWDGEYWRFKSGINTPPPERSRSRMVYDAARQQIVLFGGENDDDELNDTWTWDGSQWTEQTPTNLPDKRTYPAMAYDAARQEVVMFGGLGSGWEDDTWVWDGSEWTEEFPANSPPGRYGAMDYDPTRSVIVLVTDSNDDDAETWEWDGVNWTKRSSVAAPSARQYHDVIFNPESQKIELYNGEYSDFSREITADTWQWDGSEWIQFAVSPFVIDMSEKPDGIWNFTTIDIGQTTINFIPNTANTPVVWLASGDVSIRGTIDISGKDDKYQTELEINTPAAGGPGGFAGGLGGYTTNNTGDNVAGFPGIGPGGGIATTLLDLDGAWDGHHGSYFNTYGSPSLHTLVGGSGGGGARTTTFSDTNEWVRGGNGGGGGGAILIASSGNIFFSGRIIAIGGEGGFEKSKRLSSNFLITGISRGGSGSGGAVRLVADRILGNGFIDATTNANFRHDLNALEQNYGRIRLESYYHRVTVRNNIEPSLSFPKQTLLDGNRPQLVVASIAGQSVSATPSGDPATPEVTFSAAGDVTIIVTANNLPDATLINLRVTSNSQILTPTPVALSGGEASFTLSVPAGIGIVQAYADWTN